MLGPLVARLRGDTLRVRTALWLLPAAQLADAANEAARHSVPSRDLHTLVCDSVAGRTQFLGQTGDDLVKLLDGLSASPDSGCLLLLNLDLFLARLSLRERARVWDDLYRGLPRRRCALLVAMPDSANELLPSDPQLAAWAHQGRLAPSPYNPR